MPFQQFGISDITLRRILHIHLHFHSYKIQSTRKLKPTDHQQRGILINCMIGSFFFEDAEENAITVNGERYCDMITDFFVAVIRSY